MDATNRQKALVKIAREIFVLAIVLIAMITTSVYFRPIMAESTLSPNGSGQSGWPLAVSASYWDDGNDGDWDDLDSYQANTFNVRNLLIDILIFYVPVSLILEFLRGYISYRSNRERGKFEPRVWILRSGKRIAITALFLCMLYGAYVLYVSIATMPQPVFPH